eukprot:TRINITY_DN9910_c0_g1::TRINITY_DN9910_c0_g1_i1::g.2989::m.2989 TRINITY_DN9910_c0_g1::TRINITY_DN9910_c0_g1_i1::g.2989  ORF type:complete len:250 (+),score=50.70,sp/Q23202/SBDS_CAEEL/43.33/1e-59,SBDS/PF01172.13/1.3e-30,SBDS_C/PF09377.5/7.6e-30,DUF1284/PF06935.6/0.037 TRINITY_DN9910_c0_g1_i1:135-884(+)
MPLKQPVGQKILTNIAVVRYKRGGQRFEIACYKNKVMSWRDGSEKRLDEVLQVDKVFKSVTKGVVANKQELEKAFGSGMSHDQICMEILNKGEYQCGDKEREVVHDDLFHEIVTIVSSKIVDADTNLPLPPNMIERALKDIHFNPVSNKNAKQQALDAIKLLQKKLNIKRAPMILRASIAKASSETLKKALETFASAAPKETFAGDEFCMEFSIDPSAFRAVSDAVKKSGGSLDILSSEKDDTGGKSLD